MIDPFYPVAVAIMVVSILGVAGIALLATGMELNSVFWMISIFGAVLGVFFFILAIYLYNRTPKESVADSRRRIYSEKEISKKEKWKFDFEKES